MVSETLHWQLAFVVRLTKYPTLSALATLQGKQYSWRNNDQIFHERLVAVQELMVGASSFR